MKEKNTFYVTTPIYYPNDIPHLGHAYTTIAADILARWNNLAGKEVFFLTGTDEHGKNIEKAAEKAGKSAKDFVDSLVPEFKKAWGALNIEYDRFIRTTDEDHEEVVQTILETVNKKGDIYLGEYSGLYCTNCEAYYLEKDCPDKLCPIHKKALEEIKEESYFFKLSKYQRRLLELYEKNPDFISPENRKHEIINRVKEGLQDLSISRKNLKWGVPLPFDEEHVCYVWFDALTNYLSGVGFSKDDSLFKKFWPADIHIVGKDIIWFHTVIWPAMLLSAGIELPKKVFAHGWWKINDEKIGKSAGNAINIEKLISIAGADSARYFLFRSVPFGQDGDFSEQALVERNNNELADKLGNLVSRVSTLAEKYGLEKAETIESERLAKSVSRHLERVEFDKALNEIFAFIDSCNEYIQQKKPWESQDKAVLYQLSNAIKDISILLSPFIPETAEKISEIFSFELSLASLRTSLKIKKIKKAPILFKKIEMNKEKVSNNMVKPASKMNNIKIDNPNNVKQANHIDNKINNNMKVDKLISFPSKPLVPYTDFSKLELKIGRIISVKEHPNADKLYILTVDFCSEKRTIVAGLRLKYKKEQLVGRKATFITNLQPATIRGIESQGMILAASDDNDELSILSPEREVKEGSKIR